MKQINELLELLGLNLALLIGGGIGGIIKVRKTKRSFFKQFLYVIAATLVANYTAPLVTEIFGLSASTLPGVGFILGYAELEILDYLIETFKKKVDKTVTVLDEDTEK